MQMAGGVNLEVRLWVEGFRREAGLSGISAWRLVAVDRASVGEKSFDRRMRQSKLGRAEAHLFY
jgi:hypothetical protein